MTGGGTDKVERILGIYTKLINGAVVNKTQEAYIYKVNERSIQRDIDDIRNYFDQEAVEQGFVNQVVYDRKEKGYRLEHVCKSKITSDEVLAISKILLNSKAFSKTEMLDMIHRLINTCVVEENRKTIYNLIENESFHYAQPNQQESYIKKMWEIGQAIIKRQYIEIQYQGVEEDLMKTKKLKPLAILFLDYYFYMAAFPEDMKIDETSKDDKKPYSTFYRMDRIKSLKVLNEKFHIPYKDRFEYGEFKKKG